MNTDVKETKKNKPLLPFKTLKGGVACVFIALLVVLFFVLFSQPKTTEEVLEKHDSTPALLDSIRGLRQWELLKVEAVVEVDTTRSRLMGLTTDLLRRRYYGTLSLGIDLKDVSDPWYSAHNDTIELTLPAAKLLDDDFIDESRTRLINSSNSSFEADATVRRQMLERAKHSMKAQNVNEANLRKASQQAEEELTRLLKPIGYNAVKVEFR